jgi:hypothetical protein
MDWRRLLENVDVAQMAGAAAWMAAPDELKATVRKALRLLPVEEQARLEVWLRETGTDPAILPELRRYLNAAQMTKVQSWIARGWEVTICHDPEPILLVRAKGRVRWIALPRTIEVEL